eukprot:2174426-Pyramimonas_sp.AAC.1
MEHLGRLGPTGTANQPYRMALTSKFGHRDQLARSMSAPGFRTRRSGPRKHKRGWWHSDWTLYPGGSACSPPPPPPPPPLPPPPTTTPTTTPY